MIDPHRHSVVELLLESYHRQLVLVGHDVAAMKQEMESLQELSTISLDVSLNSMIAVDVRLAMLNLGVATSACIFGAMGEYDLVGFGCCRCFKPLLYFPWYSRRRFGL